LVLGFRYFSIKVNCLADFNAPFRFMVLII